MTRLIRERVVEKCGECGRINAEISPDVYGCDECGREISLELAGGGKRHDFLEVTVFHEGIDGSETLRFCSWRCVVNHLPKVKTDYFATFPYLHYDKDAVVGQRASDLIDLLKQIPDTHSNPGGSEMKTAVELLFEINKIIGPEAKQRKIALILSYAESVKEECAKEAEKTEGSVDVEITDNRGAFLQMKRVRFIMSGAGEAIRKQVEVK